MNKDTTFSQYLAKEKLKGNYTYDLQLDEGIGDIFKKSWHNTKKHLTGNLSDEKIELWRLNFDFSNRNFRQGLIEKCAMTLKDSKNSDDIDNAKTEIIKTITDTVNSTIDKIVGFARGANTKYDSPDTNPGSDEDEKLYTDAIKGYKYSWVQDGHLYMYYDSKDHAEDFMNEKLFEQKILEVSEDTLKAMIKIEKCTRRKGIVYDKVESENRGWKQSKTIEKAKFTDKSSEVIFDKIKDEIMDAVKNNRYGTDRKIGRIVWKLSDSDIEEFIEAKRKENPNIDLSGIGEELNKLFAAVNKKAEDVGHFLYGRGSQKGNVFLNFETVADCQNFLDEIDDENIIGEFGEPKEVKVNSMIIKKNMNRGEA